MYTYENYKFKFPTNILKGLFCIQNTLLSVVALQKPPKLSTLLRRAAKSFWAIVFSLSNQHYIKHVYKLNINHHIYIVRRR